MHPKTVLLVDNNQCQVMKFHALLEQSVRANNHLHITIFDRFQLSISRFAFHFSSQPANFNPKRTKPIGEIISVLFSQNFRRCHQGNLFAVINGGECGKCCD